MAILRVHYDTESPDAVRNRRSRFARIRLDRGGFGVHVASRDRSSTHLVDELQPVLVLGALVRELDGGRGERRRRGEHDRGGGREGERL